MHMDIGKDELLQYVDKQLENLLIYNESVKQYLDTAINRSQKCFVKTKNKYYHDANGDVNFSVFHSGQYSIFLYYLANTVFQIGNNTLLANKIYYLNKILHSVDWYHEIVLPEYWGVEHPLGSVLGRAKYSNGFFVYQGCTVGGNKGAYPVLDENVILYSNSTIIGDTHIGKNVIVSTGTIIKDENIPDNCLVFGRSPDLIIKQKDTKYMSELINGFWES